ncbi:MAG: ferrous iron transport protein A [Clostridiales Family XIII bacterium]|nr:ferrous iron transport protein A [Clostridiales Family XIII bacterium]
MPLAMANTGEENYIIKVGGKAETRKFLENLGFTPGCNVTVIAETGAGLIVRIKESRVALSMEMANKILV